MNATTRDQVNAILEGTRNNYHRNVRDTPADRGYQWMDPAEPELNLAEHVYIIRTCARDWFMARDYFDKRSEFRCDYPSCDCEFRGLGSPANENAWNEHIYGRSFRHWVLHQSANHNIVIDLDDWSEETFRDLMNEEEAWRNKKSGIGHILAPKRWAIPKFFVVKDSPCYQENINKELYFKVWDSIELGDTFNCSNCDQKCDKVTCFGIWGDVSLEDHSLTICESCKEQFSKCSKCSDIHGENMHGDLFHFKSFEKRFGSIKNARRRQLGDWPATRYGNNQYIPSVSPSGFVSYYIRQIPEVERY